MPTSRAAGPPRIGFDRYVRIEWIDAALSLAKDGGTSDELEAVLAFEITGKESLRKTKDILKRLVFSPFADNSAYISRGVGLHERGNRQSVLAFAWASAATCYPFFGSVVQNLGRLISVQGGCTPNEIHRRIAEHYGQRDGIERAVARVLQSLENWGLIKRIDGSKVYRASTQVEIHNDLLASWVCEGIVRAASRPVRSATLAGLPLLFPFRFSSTALYVLSQSPVVQTYKDGAGEQVFDVER